MEHEAVWSALKARCAADPEKATRLVMVGKEDVFAALATVAVQCEPMVPNEDGWSEWIHPIPGYLMQCCDCGLVHEMEFAIGEREGDGPLNEGESDEAGVIVFRARRYEPETKA